MQYVEHLKIACKTILAKLLNVVKAAWGFLKDRLWILVLVLIGLNAYQYFNPKTVTEIKENKVIVTETVEKEVVTTVSAKTKGNASDADVVVNTKDSLKVSVNGKTVDIKPTNKETFTYGKDYVELNQKSSYELKVESKNLEPTFQIGIGATSNNKVAGIGAVRIKKTPFHVWAMSDGKTTAGGILFSTNYK